MQAKTLLDRAQQARNLEAFTYTPRELAVRHARHILQAVYEDDELGQMHDARLLTEAQAFEDARGIARTGSW